MLVCLSRSEDEYDKIKRVKNNIMELQVGVKILLKNKEGEYLLLHRSSEKYPEVDNPWDIPGGRIEPGIPLLENLKREIKEEIGLVLEKEPELIAAQDILRIPGKHVVRLTYVGEISGEPKINPDEHNSFQWFTMEELKSLDKLDQYLKEVLSMLPYVLTYVKT